jgi:signal peptidase I
MEPTLMGHDEATGTGGDTVVVCKAAYLLADPQRWDVVALHVDDPDGQGLAHPVAMVKRIVGLPNESLEIRDGAVLVDGRPMELPPSLADVRYLRRGPHGQREVRLGPRDYFVLGDHSYLSRDSREWGPIDLDRIFGKVLAVLLPWERAAWLTSTSHAVETD